MDQWNRIENPEINPYIYGQLIFDKYAKTNSGARVVFSSRWCWDNWDSTSKSMQYPYLTPDTELNAK